MKETLTLRASLAKLVVAMGPSMNSRLSRVIRVSEAVVGLKE